MIPVTYSSCAPIHVEVNERTMPPAATGVLTEALAEVQRLTGLVLVLDGETSRVPDGDPRMLREYQPVRVHELGHVLGLDHVDDPRQLMHGDGSRVLSPGAGDLAGFRRLGQGPCVDTW